MLPQFLVPETMIHANGQGDSIAVADGHPAAVLVTLGITEVVEQEGIIVSVYGSFDGAAWDTAPLASFPQKFYTGVSTIVLDLAAHPGVQYLRAQWKTVRWGRGDKTPSFRFYVFAEAA